MTERTFQKLVERQKDKLFRFALRIVGNAAEAEDVVQEVFIKLWHQRERADGIGNLEAWLTTLTRNQAIDKLRSKHRRTEPIEDRYDMKDHNVSPHRQAELNQTVALVKKWMEDLPPKQRQIMHLRDIEGLAYKEIAEQLGLSLDQVKVNLFRARQAIRHRMQQTENRGPAGNGSRWNAKR